MPVVPIEDMTPQAGKVILDNTKLETFQKTTSGIILTTEDVQGGGNVEVHTVLAVGAKITDVNVGDRVMIHPFTGTKVTATYTGTKDILVIDYDELLAVVDGDALSGESIGHVQRSSIYNPL